MAAAIDGDSRMTDPKKPTGLDLMREPFPANAISKLPKPTAAQTRAVKDDFKAGIRCELCNGWHHPKVVHLDYVGHAALTDRLLACDPNWNWEPMAFGENGLPALDGFGGMWIKLTVCDVNRLGYGNADGKTGGDAVKELIGDALRNAAMRFGAALDLWHKGDLHASDDAEDGERKAMESLEVRKIAISRLTQAPNMEALQTVWKTLGKDMQDDTEVIAAKDEMKAQLSKPENAGLDDEIPY
jgi:hypothetical protein